MVPINGQKRLSMYTGNFCFMQHLEVIHTSLNRKDKREYVYTQEQFESASTHDEIWNAAQIQLIQEGKIHNYMRMYWCKKILEWTQSPEDAIKIALFLNDSYSLDGNDPNGFVGKTFCNFLCLKIMQLSAFRSHVVNLWYT